MCMTRGRFSSKGRIGSLCDRWRVWRFLFPNAVKAVEQVTQRVLPNKALTLFHSCQATHNGLDLPGVEAKNNTMLSSLFSMMSSLWTRNDEAHTAEQVDETHVSVSEGTLQLESSPVGETETVDYLPERVEVLQEEEDRRLGYTVELPAMEAPGQ
ncbi:MAG: hypothetical protein MHM6MM_007604, partial [Cercozoa sp. M6MM]